MSTIVVIKNLKVEGDNPTFIDFFINKIFRQLEQKSLAEIDANLKPLKKVDPEDFSFMTLLHLIIIGVAMIHVLYLIVMIIRLNCFKKKKRSDELGLRQINTMCSICMDEIVDEVQLLCSHSYCSKCIITWAKQRFSFVNVSCPLCKSISKLMVIKFELTPENEKDYEEVVKYNHEFTSRWKTSMCLCIDMFRFFTYYTRQILDFDNPRYSDERGCLLFLLTIAFCLIIIPIIGSFNDFMEIIYDLIIYCCLFGGMSESFFQRERNRNQNDLNIISVRSRRDPEAPINFVVVNNQNNQINNEINQQNININQDNQQNNQNNQNVSNNQNNQNIQIVNNQNNNQNVNQQNIELENLDVDIISERNRE